MPRCAPQCRQSMRGFVLACLLALAPACGADVDPVTRELSSIASRDNTAPIIESVRLAPATPVAGESVRVVAEVRDPDGDPVKLTYEWSLRGQPVGQGTPKLMLLDAERDDRLRVVVVASDGRDESAPARAEAYIGNRAPRVARLRIRPSLAITAGEVIFVDPEGLDPDGDALEYRYEWRVDGEVLAEGAATFDTRALRTGSVVTVEVKALDHGSVGEPLRSPPIHVVNQAPRIVSRPGAASASGPFRYAVVAEDPDRGQPLRYSLEEAPEGMEIEASSGAVRWQPRPDQAGRHRVRVIVDDQHGGAVAHAFEVRVGDAAPASVGG